MPITAIPTNAARHCHHFHAHHEHAHLSAMPVTAMSFLIMENPYFANLYIFFRFCANPIPAFGGADCPKDSK
jgi:hypothetical protein